MTKKKEKCPVIKGQYYAAKYKGTGGDLTIGQVQSVRSSGHIVSTNLLNNKTSTKGIKTFLQRNKRVSKSQATKIVAAYKKSGRDAARKVAIAAPEFRNGRGKQLELPTPKEPTMNINKDVRELLKKQGCKIKEEAGILVVTTPDGDQWDFTRPQKREKPDPSTKIIVWTSWESVTNFGTKEADYLSDGEAMCLGAFDTVEEAENFMQTLGSEKHLIKGCPGV